MTTDLLDRPITTPSDVVAPSAVTAPSWDFVPVIFANGEDDDVPGFVAAFKNERVQYGDKIYAVGEELLVDNETCRLKCTCLYVMGRGDEPPDDAGPDDVICWQGETTRSVTISNCLFIMGK